MDIVVLCNTRKYFSHWLELTFVVPIGNNSTVQWLTMSSAPWGNAQHGAADLFKF